MEGASQRLVQKSFAKFAGAAYEFVLPNAQHLKLGNRLLLGQIRSWNTEFSNGGD